MIKTEISAVVARQFPEFVRDEYPKLVAFLEAYYKFLSDREKRNLHTYRDIDETLDEFVHYIRNEMAIHVPEFDNYSARLFIRNAKEFYSAKGSESSYRSLFRMLYGKEIELDFPGTRILRASDGKWRQETSVQVQVISGNPLDLEGKEITLETLDGRVIRFFIERVRQVPMSNSFELFFDKLFADQIGVGDTIRYQNIHCLVLPTISNVSVYKRGTGFRVGSLYILQSSTGFDLTIKINSIDENGGIVSVQIVNFGRGYTNDFYASVISEFSGTISEPITIEEQADSTGGFIDSGTFFTTDYFEEDYIGIDYVGTQILSFYNDFTVPPGQTIEDDQVGILFCQIGAIQQYPGFYTTSDGFLSDAIYLQDNRYYQIFSYVIRIDEQLETYKQIVRSLVHPAGLALFGDYLLRNDIDLEVDVIEIAQNYTIGFDDSVEPEDDTPSVIWNYEFSDSVELNDTTSGAEPSLNLDDSVTALESYGSEFETGFTDTISPDDSFDYIFGTEVNLEDDFELDDEIEVGLGSDLESSSEISDEFDSLFTKIVLESFESTDTILLEFDVEFNDSISAEETFFEALLNIDLSDSIDSDEDHALSVIKSTADSVSINESKSIEITLDFTDEVSTQDEFGIEPSFLISDSVSLDDEIEIVQGAAFGDSVDPEDSYEQEVEFVRDINDTITTEDDYSDLLTKNITDLVVTEDLITVIQGIFINDSTDSEDNVNLEITLEFADEIEATALIDVDGNLGVEDSVDSEDTSTFDIEMVEGDVTEVIDDYVSSLSKDSNDSVDPEDSDVYNITKPVSDIVEIQESTNIGVEISFSDSVSVTEDIDVVSDGNFNEEDEVEVIDDSHYAASKLFGDEFDQEDTTYKHVDTTFSDSVSVTEDTTYKHVDTTFSDSVSVTEDIDVVSDGNVNEEDELEITEDSHYHIAKEFDDEFDLEDVTSRQIATTFTDSVSVDEDIDVDLEINDLFPEDDLEVEDDYAQTVAKAFDDEIEGENARFFETGWFTRDEEDVYGDEDFDELLEVLIEFVIGPSIDVLESEIETTDVLTSDIELGINDSLDVEDNVDLSYDEVDLIDEFDSEDDYTITVSKEFGHGVSLDDDISIAIGQSITGDVVEVIDELLFEAGFGLNDSFTPQEATIFDVSVTRTDSIESVDDIVLTSTKAFDDSLEITDDILTEAGFGLFSSVDPEDTSTFDIEMVEGDVTEVIDSHTTSLSKDSNDSVDPEDNVNLEITLEFVDEVEATTLIDVDGTYGVEDSIDVEDDNEFDIAKSLTDSVSSVEDYNLEIASTENDSVTVDDDSELNVSTSVAHDVTPEDDIDVTITLIKNDSTSVEDDIDVELEMGEIEPESSVEATDELDIEFTLILDDSVIAENDRYAETGWFSRDGDIYGEEGYDELLEVLIEIESPIGADYEEDFDDSVEPEDSKSIAYTLSEIDDIHLDVTENLTVQKESLFSDVSVVTDDFTVEVGYTLDLNDSVSAYNLEWSDAADDWFEPGQAPGPVNVYPNSDISVSGLTAVGGSGGDMYTRINEVDSPDDSTYVYSGNGVSATYEFGLPTITVPESGTITFRWRAAKTNAGTVTGTQNTVNVVPSLRRGSTQITAGSSASLDGTWTTRSFTVNASSIPAGDGLFMRFVVTTSGTGAVGNRRGMGLSWARFNNDVPAAQEIRIE